MDETKCLLEERVRECILGIIKLSLFRRVQFQTAYQFVEHCAYWCHPKAGWVSAPKHANRMQNGQFGYEVRFGANYFLVELAIVRCADTISDLIKRFETGNYYPYEELERRLYLNVRGAVANADGNEYSGYYPIQGRDMVFGTQSIDVQNFIDLVIQTSKIKRLYSLSMSSV